MLQSMTGYGQRYFENDQVQINVEVRSLNAKSIDISLYAPKLGMQQDMRWRTLLANHLKRGKITAIIQYTPKLKSSKILGIDLELFKSCYASLQALAQEVQAQPIDLFSLALSKYDMWDTQLSHVHISEHEFQIMDKLLQEAIQACIDNRNAEAAILYQEFHLNLQAIKTYLQDIMRQDPVRVQTIREKLHNRLKALEYPVDNARLENEMFYYIEKLDMSEEKNRLLTHIAYFEQSMMHTDPNLGKKLSFIVQEMGREVNTIGAKAYDALIQHQVIKIKEELEKIKEHLQNVL